MHAVPGKQRVHVFYPLGVTRHDLTLDVWARSGGKWVLFGPGGRETENLNRGVFLEDLHLHGRFLK